MGTLVINRKSGQRIFLHAASQIAAAELHRQLVEDGIWLELYHHDGQVRVVIDAPSGINVAREELLT